MEAKEKIIYALDGLTLKKAEEQIGLLKDFVGVFKIGLGLYPETSPDFFKKLYYSNIPFFIDLKLHDIPRTMIECLDKLQELKPRFITIHLDFRHSDNTRDLEHLSAVIKNLSMINVNVVAVSYLTCYNEKDLIAQGITDTSLEQYVLDKVRIAKTANCKGVVASVSNAKKIKETYPDTFVICPGISPNWMNKDLNYDQKRKATIDDAIREGADYLVIGSAIRNNGNYVKNTIRIEMEIEEALEKYYGKD